MAGSACRHGTTATASPREDPNRRGTEGNELLTSMTGAVLIMLLAVLGITILRIHLLGHLVDLRRSLQSTRGPGGLSGSSPGGAGRWIALAGALVGGVVLAIALIPRFAPWTTHAAFLHGH